jgi:DNA ligase (NAD+)
MGEKSVDNLKKSIQKSKKIELARFINALGIPYVGKKGARLLAKNFDSIDEIIEAEEKDFMEIEGIGKKIAESIAGFVKNSQNRKEIENLRSILTIKKENTKNKKFEGIQFVFTGSLKSMSRKKAQQKVENLGGYSTTSISGNTDVLVVGENPGSKYTKAKEKDVNIWNEKKFLEEINSNMEEK